MAWPLQSLPPISPVIGPCPHQPSMIGPCPHQSSVIGPCLHQFSVIGPCLCQSLVISPCLHQSSSVPRGATFPLLSLLILLLLGVVLALVKDGIQGHGLDWVAFPTGLWPPLVVSRVQCFCQLTPAGKLGPATGGQE
jgi:hypothetical protein